VGGGVPFKLRTPGPNPAALFHVAVWMICYLAGQDRSQSRVVREQRRGPSTGQICQTPPIAALQQVALSTRTAMALPVAYRALAVFGHDWRSLVPRGRESPHRPLVLLPPPAPPRQFPHNSTARGSVSGMLSRCFAWYWRLTGPNRNRRRCLAVDAGPGSAARGAREPRASCIVCIPDHADRGAIPLSNFSSVRAGSAHIDSVAAGPPWGADGPATSHAFSTCLTSGLFVPAVYRLTLIPPLAWSARSFP